VLQQPPSSVTCIAANSQTNPHAWNKQKKKKKAYRIGLRSTVAMFLMNVITVPPSALIMPESSSLEASVLVFTNDSVTFMGWMMMWSK
jgi:hypothetical protein